MHVSSDTRKQPKPEQAINPSSEVRMVLPAGSLLLFSGAQLHATVNNTSGRSRFSIDFRTASMADLWEHKGAPNVDASCSGTSLRDLMRGTDRTPLPAALVARYDSGATEDGVLVFQP
jgi:ectoine hydroxylase-related dioxygenase (phytanoyl-CoA dioxygenase family)